jgi:phosphatidylglycerophosphatase GEP4
MTSKYKIGQYLNIEGFFSTFPYIFKPSLLKPDLKYKNITQINSETLKNEFNIKYLVIDKDNTLTIPYINEYGNDQIKEKINEFKHFFGENNMALLSNSAGSSDDKDYKELEIVENNLKLFVIKHKNKKPNVNEEINEHFHLFNKNNKLNIKNKEICIIGDRLFVDVLMGKKYGFFTILLEPIDYTKENIMVKLVRKIEKLYI